MSDTRESNGQMDVKSIHIDWLSASYILSEQPMDVDEAQEKFTEFVKTMPPVLREVFQSDGWEKSHGRRPYPGGWHNTKRGIYVWLGGQSHVLIEVTGKGAQTFRDADALSDLMVFMRDRCSRLDIAIDIETDKMPEAVVAGLDTKRFKSRSSMTSQHGQTEYIGSKQSQRYCRVYRYSEPHPRHKLLRIEFVIKKPHTQYAIDSYLGMGSAYTSQQLINTFGLESEINVENHNETMPATRNDRKNSKTEAWLIRQAAPAFERLVREGTITDWQQWLRDHFLSGILTMDNEEQMPLPWFETDNESESE